MILAVAQNSKHGLAAYPPNLVHGDDGGGGERLEEVQNHFECFVSFGLQHHHNGLREDASSTQSRRQVEIHFSIQMKGCLCET